MSEWGVHIAGEPPPLAGVWRNPRRCQRNETLNRSGGCRRPRAVAPAQPPTSLSHRRLHRLLPSRSRVGRSLLPQRPLPCRHPARTSPQPWARCVPVGGGVPATRPLPISSARWRSESRSLPAGSFGGRFSRLRAPRHPTPPSNAERPRIHQHPLRARAEPWLQTMRCPQILQTPPWLPTMSGHAHDRRESTVRRKSRPPCLRPTP